MRIAIVIAAGVAAVACGSDEVESTPDRPATQVRKAPPPKNPCPDGAEVYKREAKGSPTVTACRLPNGDFHGNYSAQYADGTKTAEGAFDNAKRHGAWIYRHPNGQTWKKGSYVHGKLDGEWKQFAETGKLLGTYTLRSGTGTEARWWDNGNKRQEVTWSDGAQSGLTTRWFETGEKLSEATYEAGELHGTWTHWDAKGQTRKVENWKRGIIESTVWYENGVPLTQ
jgi:antitoxin component YwqK of YwqJK toxin-antitoxin module